MQNPNEAKASKRAGRKSSGQAGALWGEALDFIDFFCLLFCIKTKKWGGVWGKAPVLMLVKDLLKKH